MCDGRRPLVAAATAALFALAFLCGSQAAPLSIPTKDKKSPEVIYFEGAADDSSVDKRVDKSIAAAAIAWPSFREDLRNREKAAAAAAAASRDSGADKLAHEAGASGGVGGAGQAGKANVAGSNGGADADEAGNDKALLAEALMRMLMDELEDSDGERDEITGSDYSSHDAAYEDAAEGAGEEEDEAYGNGDALPEPGPSRELNSPTWADAAARAPSGSAPQRARPAGSAAIAPKTTRAPSTTTTVAAATENDGTDYEEDNDSREDKRVRVDVSGGLPGAGTEAAAKSPSDGSAGDKTTGHGKAEAVEDPYKEYLDMWYRTNIAEDYEEDSVARLRNYLENLKYSKAADKKPRTKATGAASKISGATPRSGKAEPATGGSRRKRSLLDDYDDVSAYVGEREPAGGEGVYLTAAEARQLRRLVVGLNEQNDKYAAKLRDLLAADDSAVAGRARYPEAYGRDDYEASNRNLYRLAYGLAAPSAANVGYY